VPREAEAHGQDWLVYHRTDDLKALSEWLDQRLPKEAALRTALHKAFPVLTRSAESSVDTTTAMDVVADTTTATAAAGTAGTGDDKKHTAAESDSQDSQLLHSQQQQQQADSSDVEMQDAAAAAADKEENSSSDVSADSDNEVNDAASDVDSDVSDGSAGGAPGELTTAGGAPGGIADEPEEGEGGSGCSFSAAEHLALALCDAPDCELPPEEETVAFEDDDIDGGDAAADSEAVQFHSRRYYALAIVDSDRAAAASAAAASAAAASAAAAGGTDGAAAVAVAVPQPQPLRLPRALPARIEYDIYRDGVLVASDKLDRPFSKTDAKYYFRVAKFKRTGSYVIRFALVLTGAAAGAAGAERVKDAPPLSFSVRVTAK
jgi:hypothetical protein